MTSLDQIPPQSCAASRWSTCRRRQDFETPEAGFVKDVDIAWDLRIVRKNMPIFHALVDYYNQAGFRPGSRPSYRDHEQAVERLVQGVARIVDANGFVVEELRMRLYGGWYEYPSGAETHDKVHLAQITGRLPRRLREMKTRPRLLVEAAECLIAYPGERFVNTVRPESLPSRITVEPPPANCSLRRASCPLTDLATWCRGRCPVDQCRTRTSDVASFRKQKLIDTMLVADTIMLSMTDDFVGVVSIDDDILPGVLAAGRRSDKVVLIRFGKQKRSIHDDMINEYKIRCIDVGA
ncbi:MAG: hypothetical protein IPM54_21520 [Polyangiaceae bacterium]|nr:hypothetical protein [Polyangiaceae bacterium]